MELFVQQLFNGLSLASIYIMIALGLQIIFGLMRIINLAHGEFLLVGAYVTFVMQTAGVPFLFSLMVAVIVAIIVGFILEKSVIRYLYEKPLDTLLVTWGLSIILRESSKLIFGPAAKPIANPLPGVLEIGVFTFPYWRLVIILTCFIIVFLLHYLLTKSDIGLKVRSTLENTDLSMSLGINVQKMYQYTFIFGAVLASIAGAMIIPLSAVSPEIGLTYLLPSFLVVIIGGLGSFKGTVYGGLFIGILTSMLTLLMSSVLAEILVFIVVIIALRFRPEGVFVGKTA